MEVYLTFLQSDVREYDKKEAITLWWFWSMHYAATISNLLPISPPPTLDYLFWKYCDARFKK